MKIDSPTGDPDCARSQYTVRFEERQVEDLRFDVPNAAFEKVRGMSETNELFYKTFVSPVLSAMSNPWSASALEWLHPMRTSRYLLSEAFSPWMHAVAALAPLIRKERTPLPADNPFAAQEQAASAQVTQAIEDGRKHRDEAMEWWFALVFGAMPGRLGAA